MGTFCLSGDFEKKLRVGSFCVPILFGASVSGLGGEVG